MKVSLLSVSIVLVFVTLLSAIFPSCKKDENPIKFPKGSFPDSIINLRDLNSEYDDYNVDSYELHGNIALVFSSNRKSSGGQFDIEQGNISYHFDQTNGNFNLESDITNDSFLNKILGLAATPGDDFGPYRLFSTADGFEYFLISSVNGDGDLDLFYLKNAPVYGSNIPEITGPKPVTILNSSSDDAYICFDLNMDTAYFTSNRNGDFDILLHSKSVEEPLSEWFDLEFESSSEPDSINSKDDDKCPSFHRNVMVFASNRLGGMGGYDLYYSILKNGNWSSPVNFGPKINTSADEYRPVLGSPQDFTNSYMIFSSNRSGGKGGFDLYFMGLDLPK